MSKQTTYLSLSIKLLVVYYFNKIAQVCELTTRSQLSKVTRISDRRVLTYTSLVAEIDLTKHMLTDNDEPMNSNFPSNARSVLIIVTCLT